MKKRLLICFIILIVVASLSLCLTACNKTPDDVIEACNVFVGSDWDIVDSISWTKLSIPNESNTGIVLRITCNDGIVVFGTVYANTVIDYDVLGNNSGSEEIFVAHYGKDDDNWSSGDLSKRDLKKLKK